MSMKIERIDLYHLNLTLRVPFEFSAQVMAEREILLTTVYAEGLTGWGECPAGTEPSYSYETAQTAWHVATSFLIPNLLGKDLQEPEDVLGWMGRVRGHPFAKSMFDMAAWDLVAQRDGLSFAQKLAEPYPEGPRLRVETGISIGIRPSAKETLEVIAGYREHGYNRIKLKIKPGHDVELARAARAAYPEAPIMLDANSGYSLPDAAVFQAMHDLDLLMVEQPLGYDDILDHSRLRPQIQIPLCLDESIHSLGDAELAVELQACDIINIKPFRVGGWTESRKILDLCVANGIRIWIGGMLETGVGMAGKVALAALPGVTLPNDIAESYERYPMELTEPFLLNREDSTITVPTGPGLGVAVDEKQLEAVTLWKETFV
jgi:O-succinylbenzoate synthase